jgi:hypothetical protein
MAEITWGEFVKKWRSVDGKGLTYGQAMVACSPIWNNPTERANYITKHFGSDVKIEKIEEPKEDKLEDIKEPREPSKPIAIQPTAKGKETKDLKYYQAKARYFKYKAAK